MPPNASEKEEDEAVINLEKLKEENELRKERLKRIKEDNQRIRRRINKLEEELNEER